MASAFSTAAGDGGAFSVGAASAYSQASVVGVACGGISILRYLLSPHAPFYATLLAFSKYRWVARHSPLNNFGLHILHKLH